ncbi:hypothetical protein OIU79_023592 [Salix purpurea]|uniref:Uncharacterized protein n=1 Tax=Salix purpurea TaxID=77065 RepID=A0A9Q0WA71_SALPP|nr:hypothetical protein OIU79_023592 [Salix purpurea]
MMMRKTTFAASALLQQLQMEMGLPRETMAGFAVIIAILTVLLKPLLLSMSFLAFVQCHPLWNLTSY